VVNLFRWVKESTESQTLSLCQLPLASRVLQSSREIKKPITEHLRTHIYHLMWRHQVAIQRELWIFQDSRKGIAETHLDLVFLEERHLLKAGRVVTGSVTYSTKGCVSLVTLTPLGH